MIYVLGKRSFSGPSSSGVVALLIVAAMSTFASAAVLSLDDITRVNTTSQANLTYGNADWAYWAPTTETGQTAPVAPTNRKLGGSIISSISNVGGTTLRGSATETTVEQYTYTDGISPTSAINASLTGWIFNSDQGSAAVGKGFSLTLTGDPAKPSIAKLYFGGSSATGKLTLTLNGATAVVNDKQDFSRSELAIYTVRYQPDIASDVLTVQFTMPITDVIANGHLAAQAVTVAVVPEPGMHWVTAVGMIFLGRRASRVK